MIKADYLDNSTGSVETTRFAAFHGARWLPIQRQGVEPTTHCYKHPRKLEHRTLTAVLKRLLAICAVFVPTDGTADPRMTERSTEFIRGSALISVGSLSSAGRGEHPGRRLQRCSTTLKLGCTCCNLNPPVCFRNFASSGTMSRASASNLVGTVF